MTCALASTASADLGRVVAIGDSLAAGTSLGPAIGTYPRCGQTSGSYPELAMARVKKSAWVNATCNGGHAGVFSNGWKGLNSVASDPTIPPQYDSLNGSEQVVIVGSGGNEAYYGEVMSNCMGHSEDYNLNKCAQVYGADGAGLLAKTQGSKTTMATVLDTVHQKSPNAKVFLIGTPRIAPPDGAGCWPNPILTLADAPVWTVWEDSLRQAMIDDVASRSSWATFVDSAAAGGSAHSMCAPTNMRWMNPWTVENIPYPGLALHNTPWGADAMADLIVSAIKSAGLSTGTPSAPALARTLPSASPTNSTSQTFTYSGTGGNTLKCRLDNAAYAVCPSSPASITGLASGSHTYSVTQTDASGNVSPAATVTWTVDAVAPAAPTVTRTSPSVSPTGSATQTITYEGAETGGTFQCKLDAAAYAACPSSPVTLNGLTTGTHTYSVTQTDGAGNVSPVGSVTWVVDVTPPGAPTVTRTSPSSTPTNSTTQVLTYSGAEVGGTFQCKLDSAAYAACTGSPVTLTGLGAGTHTYSVTQTDALGNVGSATTVTWSIDLTAPGAPTVTRTAPTVSPTNSSNQTISYSGAEGGGTYQCKLDSVAAAACPASPVVLSALSGGSHAYSVTQTDAAGNVSAATAVSWTIDVTPPPTPIVSGPSGTTAFPTASISYSGTEAGVTFQCKLDSAAYDVCPASPIGLSGLANGAHTYSVTATDAAGNTSAAGTVSWNVDPSGFTTSITGGPNNPSTVSGATFSFVATFTSGTTYECKLDGGSFASCASPKVYSGLADGTHTFTVHAINSTQTTPDVSRTWTIDATPPGAPTLTRTTPTTSPTNSTAQTFSLTAAEAGGVLTCKLDGDAPVTCPSSPITVTGLSEGTHTYSVAQTDAAGNTGSASTVSWSVDSTPPSAPSVTRTSPTVTPTSSTSQSISYSGIEGGALVQCKVDTGAYAPCAASPLSFSGLAEGSHTVSIIQTDAAGNVSTAGSASWFVDSIAPAAPTLTRDSPTATPTNSSTQAISFSGAEAGGTFQCKLDLAAYAACPASPLTLSSLGNGSHSYSVRQIDATGNVGAATSVTWTVDLIAPSAPGLGFNRPSVTKVNSATIGYTPTEAGGTMQCAMDSGAWTICPASPIELVDVPDGNHNYAIRQVDAAGNIGAGTQVSWLIDTVAPSSPAVTLLSPTSSPTYDTTASIGVDPGEPGGTLLCKLDGGAWANCPSRPIALSNLAIGTHTYSVTQTDPAGNVSATGSVTWMIGLDTTPPAAPAVTRTAPTANPTTSTAQTIGYSGAEAGGSFQCKLDAAAYSACPSSPISIGGLANGAHTYSVTQTDNAGNVSSAGSVTWTVDTIAPAAPTVTRTSPTGNPTPSTTQTITYSGAEAGGSFQCKLDAAAATACPSSPVVVSGLTDGAHSYSVTQTDAAGNVGSTATVTWLIDTSAPSQPLVDRTSPTASPTNSTSQTFAYSGEAGGSFQCKLDAGAYAACATSPLTITSLSDGPHSYSVRQTDALGNVGQPTTVTWTVDTTPPSAPPVTRTAPTATPTNSTSQTIAYSGIEPGATTSCKLDSGSPAACATSPITLSALSGGTHTFTVTQTDAAGNTSAASAVSWVVDVTAPQAPSVSGPSGTTGLTTATVSYSNPEGGVTFLCKLDSAAYAPCPASPVTLSGLANGSHTYYVTATDPAGNVSPAGTATWTVDPSTFGASITSAPSDPSATGSAAFSFAYSGAPSATLECKLDNGVFAPCASPKSYSALSDGSHTFTVRAVNGVQTTPEVSRTWTIDTTPPGAPTLTRSNPSATPTSSSSQTLSFVGTEPGGVLTCQLNDSTIATCPSSPVTLTGLGDGVYTLTVTQTDSAGNVGPPATVTWIVDSVSPAAPVVTRTSPSADPTSQTTQTISYSGEAGSLFECKLDSGPYEVCAGSPVTLTNLSLGSHIFSVRQTDGAGNSSPAVGVAWTIEAATPEPPAPTGTTETPTLSASLSAVGPKAIKPAASGLPFSTKPRGSAGSFRVTLSAPATVSLRLERVVGRTTRASTTWTKLKLKAGRSTVYLSGRSNGRPLPAGVYKVRLTASGGTTNVLSKSFRIKR